MAITQTGTVLRFDAQYGATGTASSTITVPADAEFVIVGVSGYMNTANFYSGGVMTFTKGGVDTAMTSAVTGASGADNNTSRNQAAMFWMVLPDTGTNKSLKWDWAGTGGAILATLLSVTFFKGVDTASPVRDAKGAQAGGAPYTTPTLTASAGDLIVAWLGAYQSAAEGTVNSWSNLTEIADVQGTGSGFCDGAWAAGSPSGNTPVAASTVTGIGDGGIIGLVLKPASGGGATQYPASGTVAATSTTEGAATARLTAAGTVTATSTTSGSASVLRPATGTVAAVSDASGQMTARLPATGTTAATSTASGSMGLARPASGTADALSTTSGSANALLPASGTVDAVSTTSGSANALLPAAGTVAATSSTEGSATALLPASGTVDAVSGTSGSATPVGSSSGTVEATSTTSGSMTAQLGASGTVAATSTTSGTADVPGGMSGTVLAVSATSGAMTLRAAVSGTVAVVSVTTAAIAARLGAAGTVTTVSVVSGQAGVIRAGEAPPSNTRVWDGAAWVPASWRRWDGAAWVPRSAAPVI